MEKKKIPEGATQIGLLYHTRPYLQIEIEWANYSIDPKQIESFELENWMSLTLTMKDGSKQFIDLKDYDDINCALDLKRGFEFSAWFDEDGEEL
jgi:hypothetical protein